MKKLKLYLISAIIVSSFAISCKKDNNFGEVVEKEPLTLFQSEGVWVVNEGLFGHGNGELSFIDLKNKKIYNSQFFAANGIPAGDVPTSVLIDKDILVLIVNNSSRIFVLNRENLKIKQTISNIPSPRKIAKITDRYYAISSFTSDSLYFLNIGTTSSITSSMYIGKSTENLVFHNGKIYLSNWSEFGGNWQNNSIMKIDPFQKKIDKILIVSKEPNSLVIDKNSNIWVLCSGGYMNEEFPSLHKVDINNFEIIKSYNFSNKSESPFSLSIDKSGENISFINHHIYEMSINANSLPSSPILTSGTENFYYINSEILENYIVISNARNYQVSGEVIFFKKGSGIEKRYECGINPGYLIEN